jgi:site-specific recombinase XerD
MEKLKFITSSNWRDYLDDLILIKKVEGLRERTIQDYIYHVTLFFKNYPDALNDFSKLSFSIKEYFLKKCAPATFNIRRLYLKAFFSYLTKEDIIPANPITFPKRKDEGKVYNISEETLKKLLTLPNKNTFAGLRDYCLILLTLDTGIRPKEAFNLFPKDINLEGMEITVRKEVSKTNVTRTLPISPLTIIYLKKLLRVRPAYWNEKVPVFCSCTGEYLTNNTWEQRLTKYSKKLNFKIIPYSLRHCFALYYLRNGGNVFTLQRTMGHSDLNTTKKYLALNIEDLKRDHTAPFNSLY